MPCYHSRRQTFCILVMIMAISMGSSTHNNKSSSGNVVGGVEAARERIMGANSEEVRERMGGNSSEREEGVKAGGVGERMGDESRERNMGSDGNELMEEKFMEWVKFVGSLRNHSVFGVAKNVFDLKSTLVVDKTPGKGHFTTIQQAVNSVPNFNLFRVVIQINPGIYTEKVSIPWSKPYITFQGAGSNYSIIHWNDTAGTKGSDGKPLGTFNSATVAIDAPYFIARNLTFKNTAARPIPGETNMQASAVRVSGDASAFVGCQFLGAQDTLYDHKGRHFFQDCYIEGSVDFIFGDGLSMYQNCHLHAIGARYQSITAQSRSSLLEDSGFSFVKCKVTGSGPLYLGRAWGSFSRVVYAYTYMDDIIVPKGWYNWGDPKREGTVYYGQYKCTGLGASAEGRVAWSRDLTDEEAQPFLDLTFVDGKEWIGL